MGVYDYSCIIYSYGLLDGDQCLFIPQKGSSNENDNVEVWDGWEDYDNLIDMEDGDLFQMVIDEDESRGSNTAMLEIIVFDKDLNVTKETLRQHLIDKTYALRFFKELNYSWDAWDFYDDDDNYLGYHLSDSGMKSVWKLQRSDKDEAFLGDLILDTYPGKDIWIRNISINAYERYLTSTTIPDNVSNFDLCYVAYLFDILWRGKTRNTLYQEIRNFIKDKFVYNA